MKIKEFQNIFEAQYPANLAFDGDNVGLLVGDEEAQITKVLVTCDADVDVVSEAIENGANLIVSHHPLMFHPVCRMTESNAEQRAIRLMIENGISLYSAHTNLDAGAFGLNDLMASMLGLENTQVVDVVCQNERGVHGYGRMCSLKTPTTMGELLAKVSSVFDAQGVKYTGSLTDEVKKLAVNTGAGSSIIDKCIEAGCDTLITGDIKYNTYRDALDMGLKLIDIMHFDSEKISKIWFEKWFEGNLPQIQVIKSKANVNAVKVY